MSAVAMLAIAFTTIVVVGTALAAVHDVIAAAIARADDEAAYAELRAPNVAASGPRLERPAQRSLPTQAPVRVRVRGVDGAAVRSARA
jgi:flavin-binding protein dodecin